MMLVNSLMLFGRTKYRRWMAQTTVSLICVHLQYVENLEVTQTSFYFVLHLWHTIQLVLYDDTSWFVWNMRIRSSSTICLPYPSLQFDVRRQIDIMLLVALFSMLLAP